MNEKEKYAPLWEALQTYSVAIQTMSDILRGFGTDKNAPTYYFSPLIDLCNETSESVEKILSEFDSGRNATASSEPQSQIGATDIDHNNDYLPDEFVVFDLETTGLDANVDEIIEIGAILVRRSQVGKKGQDVPTLQSFVRASKPIPTHITNLTGITQSMLDKNGVELSAALEEFRGFIGDRRLVAYNAKFDMAFMREAMQRHGIELSNPVSCALNMARRAWPDRSNYKLDYLAKAIDAGDAHRAIADCIRAMAVYIVAVRLLCVVE
jgi:DNA polymerase III subunit epsilon